MEAKCELELGQKVLLAKCQVKSLNLLMKMKKVNSKTVFLLFNNKNKNCYWNYKNVRQSKE